jgi:hypothetical protein
LNLKPLKRPALWPLHRPARIPVVVRMHQLVGYYFALGRQLVYKSQENVRYRDSATCLSGHSRY